MGRKYLVTGGAGFIGSNFIRHLADVEPNARIVNLDLLTYAGVDATVQELDKLDNHQFVHGDVRDGTTVDQLVAGADVIVNFAAESHVDRSIASPQDFLTTNVVGTGVLLDAARRHGTGRFVHVSTDEVYGPVLDGSATEEAPLNPSSPYAASKAAADHLVAAYSTTYGYRAVVTRGTNNYGPHQYPEKLVSLSIARLLSDEQVQLYGDGLHERDWLWVGDHCAAVHLLVDKGESGEIYNIGSGVSTTNREVVEMLAELTGSDSKRIKLVSDRPGHDRRYSVDSSRLRRLGWEPQTALGAGLAATVEWYRAHRDWWQPLLDGSIE